MKEVKIGVIGTARGSTIIRGTRTVPNHKVVAMCDRNEARLARGCEWGQVPDAKRYTDHKQMLREADLDAILLAVAPEDNAALVCEMLAAGKHVLCEVPLAFTLEDCWKIVLAVEKSGGLKFQLAEQVRFAPYIQSWKKMVAEGRLGKILVAEGEYLHAMNESWYWLDPKTGKGAAYKEALANPEIQKKRMWNMPHPILYLPHELSPMLSVLDDRVVKVTGMGTRKKSYIHEWLPIPDVEVAIMHTANDTVMKLTAGFGAHCIRKTSTNMYHWYHFMGTKGIVESNRADCDKMKMWFSDSNLKDPAELMWEYVPGEVPNGVITSGHGGGDYYPLATFVDSILNDTDTVMDVYKATECAAPAIMAAKSIELNSRCLDVPDFRPGEKRKKGQAPESV